MSHHHLIVKPQCRISLAAFTPMREKAIVFLWPTSRRPHAGLVQVKKTKKKKKDAGDSAGANALISWSHTAKANCR